MIEAWWRTLKHQWLFLNALDTAASIRRLVAFYVSAHNSEIPHSAFRGQTPDEMYFGYAEGIPEQLEAAKRVARKMRTEANAALSCGMCSGWRPRRSGKHSPQHRRPIIGVTGRVGRRYRLGRPS